MKGIVYYELKSNKTVTAELSTIDVNCALNHKCLIIAQRKQSDFVARQCLTTRYKSI